jgi:hypothetical protein
LNKVNPYKFGLDYRNFWNNWRRILNE